MSSDSVATAGLMRGRACWTELAKIRSISPFGVIYHEYHIEPLNAHCRDGAIA